MDTVSEEIAPKSKMVHMKSGFLLMVACSECVLYANWLPKGWFVLAQSFSFHSLDANNSIDLINPASRIADHRSVYPTSLLISALALALFGSMFDSGNIFRLRMISVFLYLCSTCIMTFTSHDLWLLVYPGYSLLVCCADGILLSNISLCNAFQNRRNLVFSTMVASRHLGSLLVYGIAINTSSARPEVVAGANVQTYFMFMTGGVVTLLVASIAVFARRTTPRHWPLDINNPGHQAASSYSIASYVQRRRLCEPEVTERDRNKRKLKTVLTSKMFFVHVTWYIAMTCFINTDIYRNRKLTRDVISKLVKAMIAFFSSIAIGIGFDFTYKRITSESISQKFTMFKMAGGIGLISFITVVTSSLLWTQWKGSILTSVLMELLTYLTAVTSVVILANLQPYENFGRLFSVQYITSKIFSCLQYLLCSAIGDSRYERASSFFAVSAILTCLFYTYYLLLHYKSHKFSVPCPVACRENTVQLNNRSDVR